ncbi:MAG: NAD(P)-dependent oxidoreductase [Sulfuricella denitrificans]|nr:NAD(P)-dependent oxidoreductase [Sulfuricella denitrificans]
MKTILITGANGFVGSHILAALQGKGVRTIAACRDASKLPSWYQGEVRSGDLRDPAYLKGLLEGVGVVCHAAAWTSLWGHAKESRELFYQPTMKLLDACVAARIERFLFVSTTSAAAPDASHDPQSRGIARSLWPHLCHVVAIEDAMRERAGGTTAMVNLRCGLFAGERYGLGLLPILLPRLKTHLVPWVAGGKTAMPIMDGQDIGRAFALAALHPRLAGYEAFNIVGAEIPSVHEVLVFLSQEFGYPLPHFGVPFPAAYVFGWLMEKLDPFVPWEPLVTRSIIHLLEEVNVSGEDAAARLGFRAQIHWKDAIRRQLAEYQATQKTHMKMFRPLPEANRH